MGDGAGAPRGLAASLLSADQALAQLDALFMSVPVGLGFVDRALRYVRVNQRLADIKGVSPEDHIGRTLRELIPELADELEPHYRTVLETGEPVTDLPVSGRLGADPATHDWLVSYYPVPSASGTIDGVGILVQDVTARRAAERQVEFAQDQLEFLANVSDVLSSSLNYRRTLSKLANLIVPHLADWCAIDIVEDDNRPHQVVVAHVDPAKVAFAEELRQRWPIQPDSATGAPNVIRTGQSELYEEITEELLLSSALDEEHLDMLRQLGLRSIVVVPLTARGRTLGAVTLVHAESGRTYRQSHVEFIEDVARRAANAIDNARLYQERSRVARALQRALLPADLPDIEGVALAATYRPMSESSEIGGDFYDVFETADGSWTVVVGDVEGKGPEAAAVTGLARHTIRAAAVRERSPSRILSLLNEVLIRDHEVPRFCTVALGKLTVGGGRASVAVALGGHPSPLLVRADGTVETIEVRGTLLGLFPAPAMPETVVELGPGESLVLYTDGVTEARREGTVFGDERLVDVVRAAADADPRHLADAIEQAVVDWQPEHREDDLAILVLRVNPT